VRKTVKSFDNIDAPKTAKSWDFKIQKSWNFYELDPDPKPACEENLAAECNATLETQQNIPVWVLKAASSRVRQASSSTGKKRGFFSKFSLRKDIQIEQCPQLEELGEEHTPLSPLLQTFVYKNVNNFSRTWGLGFFFRDEKKESKTKPLLIDNTNGKQTHEDRRTDGRTHTHDDRLTDPYEVHTGCIRGSIP
jgi:hypothetical protein